MELDSRELMILKEIGNIGAGQSSILLAKLLNRDILLEPGDIRIIKKEDLFDAIGAPQGGVFGLYMALYEDIIGDSMVLFKNDSLARIIDLAKEKKLGTTRHVKQDINKQIIKDIAYRVLVPYIESLSQMLEVDIKYTVPIPVHENSKQPVSYTHLRAHET